MGLGFKDWAAGDVLTAADVDGYLMRQTVMTFADASARDTALSGVLDEGMVAYLEDVNALTVYNGSAWVAVIDSDVLTVDTANDRVGINDATPSYALDVTGDINATGQFRIGGTVVGEAVAFTPSWTNLTPGNAVESWHYVRVNDLLYFAGETVLGSTSSVTGLISMDFPVGTQISEGGILSGTVLYVDASPLKNIMGNMDQNASDIRFFVYTVSGSQIGNAGTSSSSPFIWTTNDTIRASGVVALA